MIHKVAKSEIQRASAVLADAFRKDPLVNKLSGEGPGSDKKNQLINKIFLNYYFKYGQVMASSENFEGVMAWSTGNLSFMTIWRMMLSGAIVPFLKLGLKDATKIGVAFEPMDKDRKRHMHGVTYIYLAIIGVSTTYQGNGCGGKMLQSLIEISNQKRIPIYLETESDKNVSFYEKFKFKTLDQITLPLIDQTMWEMKRDPG